MTRWDLLRARLFSLVRRGAWRSSRRPVYPSSQPPLYGWNRVLNAVDLVFGSSRCIAAPAMLAIAVGSQDDLAWPVLFRQERMGPTGALPHAESSDHASRRRRRSRPHMGAPDDPAVRGWVLLRRWSFDELPQFFNVLRVREPRRPRPERPSFVESFRRRVPGYMLRHKMKAASPGGPDQRLARHTSIEKRFDTICTTSKAGALASTLKICFNPLVSLPHKPQRVLNGVRRHAARGARGGLARSSPLRDTSYRRAPCRYRPPGPAQKSAGRCWGPSSPSRSGRSSPRSPA